MASPESIAAAFARGLMEGLLKSTPEKAKPERGGGSVKSVVREELSRLLGVDDVPRETVDQLDMFSAGLPHVETYDPNIGASEDNNPWQSPH